MCSELELVGLLSGVDKHGKVRVLLLESTADGAADYSLPRLRGAAPQSAGKVPYRLDAGPARGERLAGSAGVLGEFWVTPPRARSPREALYRLVTELKGREVRVRVLPKRYSFVSGARHNPGDLTRGTLLQYVGLEERLTRGC